MPQVVVTQDPIVVGLIVGLIGGATILALLFAGPWSARVPRVPSPPAVAEHEPSEPIAPPTTEPVVPITTPPAPPADAPPEPAWSSTRHTPTGHD